MTIAMISGGFDPLHIGHIDLITIAKQYGNVWVALNSDAWLMRKKGFVFMPYGERRGVLEALCLVEGVVPARDEDGTVCEALRSLKPDHFVNGGDRQEANPAEAAVCEELGIIQIFEGDKVQSSSALVKAVR